MNQPRKHHVVPCFYLAGFSDDGTKTGKLHITSKDPQKTWTSSPQNSARHTDFYKVDRSPNGDPMFVENLLAKIEDNASSIIGNIRKNRQLPNQNDLDQLMFFVSFLAVRVPMIRQETTEFFEQVRRKEEFVYKYMKQQGQEVDPSWSSEYANVSQTSHIETMVQNANKLVPILKKRTWQLWDAKACSINFICSDCPVVPFWAIHNTGVFSPGFETKNAIVSFPVDKDLVMVSMLECDVGQKQLKDKDVALINNITLMHSTQIYSPHEKIAWLLPDGTIADTDDLFKSMSELIGTNNLVHEMG